MRHFDMLQRMTHTDLIGSTEAAQILGKSNRTIHRLVESGELKPSVVAPGGAAGAFLFERADVEELAAQAGGAA